jgi:cytochrome c peroxidase
MVPKKGPLAKALAIAVISTLLPYGPVSTYAAAPSELAGLLAQFPVIVPPDFVPLSQIPVPEPSNIFDFVKNKPAAIRLGKAFFWEMQVGSDGIQACASCHHSAGVDKRMKNTLNPGAKAGDTAFGNNNLPGGVPGFPQFGPNYTLQPGDFPFHLRGGQPGDPPPDLQSSPIRKHTNDVVGSQGVRRANFNGIIPGSAVDDSTPVADPIFNVAGVNTRRVTGRNTPSMINAIFNFNNFWDGRAYHSFNGNNPFGPADVNAGVWFNDPVLGLVKRAIDFDFASPASQAVGPPLDDTEMSAAGRTFPELGRKMLSLTPLGRQLVHPGDSVLGLLSRASRLPDGRIQAIPGLVTTYSPMIQDAFVDTLWNSATPVVLQTIGGPVAFTQMEANFSLFWGLAIQLYVATLVADQTPFDRFLGGNTSAMTDQQQLGLALFNGIGKCSGCHGGTEMTNASVTASGFLDNQNHALIEVMFVADGAQVIYDNGYNNTAVTPTTDDIARGGGTPAPLLNPLTGNQPFPLSFSALAELQELGRLTFDAPILDEFIPPDFPVNKDGLFKVPGLRNVELTAPFFHNGSVMTLEEVVDFYVRGGNFPQENIHDLDPLIGEGIPLMQGNETMHAALVAFMEALTDDRVRNQSAPFDHPELLVPIPNDDGTDLLIRIAATDLNGAPAQTLLTLNPVTTPTPNTSQTISGTVEAGLTPVVTVDTGATAAVTVNGTNWSADISGLIAGPNVITVSVVDPSGPQPTQTTLTATIVVIANNPPTITSTAITTAGAGQLYNYDVNATDPDGDALTFSLVTAPAGMTIQAATGLIAWTPTVAQAGPNNVTVRATDPGGLFAEQSFTITVTTGAAITGRVTASVGGLPMAGVTITLIGPVNMTVVTDSLGNYSLTGLPNGAYTIKPFLAGFRFRPRKRLVTVAGADLTGQNFIGSARR